MIQVREDTRRLRRLLTNGRAKILSATVVYKAGRWLVSIAVEAADLHPAQQHPARPDTDIGGWVGADRGLSAFLVAATGDGTEVDRVTDHPKPLAAALRKQRRLARAVTRKAKGSNNRWKAVARLGRHHRHIRNIREHFLHQVSTRLVKTHDRLVLEDLNIVGMQANRHLSRAISDAGWGELARQIGYKQAWRGGQVYTVDRWFPSSRTCARCRTLQPMLRLADRVFTCGCGYTADRDLNAATNLAVRAEEDYARAREPETRAPVINAC